MKPKSIEDIGESIVIHYKGKLTKKLDKEIRREGVTPMVGKDNKGGDWIIVLVDKKEGYDYIISFEEVKK